MGASESTERDLKWILKVARTTALSMGATAYEADEVSQLTGMKIWMKWTDPHVQEARERGTKRWHGYVKKTAKNVHWDLIREHQRRIARQHKAAEAQFVGSPATGGVWTPTSPSGIEAYMARAMLAEEIFCLPELQRKVAFGIFIRDMTVKEVAAIMGIQDQSVRKHLRAAREALRERLTEAEKQLH